MKAKLIKKKDGWYNLYQDNIGIGSTHSELQGYKLSLKNCQAIERGYDLDELAKIEYPICEVWNDEEALIRELAFKKGFKKALELLGDKNYSEENLATAYAVGYGDFEKVKNSWSKLIQSLQQTEWDVEILMEKVKDETKIVGAVKNVKGSGNKITTYKSVPKHDEDGCLILKRI